MTIADDRKRYEQAKLAGYLKGQAGGKESDCPYRRGTNDVLREAWQLGYQAGLAARRRRA